MSPVFEPKNDKNCLSIPISLPGISEILSTLLLFTFVGYLLHVIQDIKKKECIKLISVSYFPELDWTDGILPRYFYR